MFLNYGELIELRHNISYIWDMNKRIKWSTGLSTHQCRGRSQQFKPLKRTGQKCRHGCY